MTLQQMAKRIRMRKQAAKPPRRASFGEKVYEAFSKGRDIPRPKGYDVLKVTPKGVEYGVAEGLGSRLGRLGVRAGVLGGGILLATGGAMLGKHLYGKMMEPISFRKDFTAMMDHDKTLKQYDRDQVEARFRSLRKFNPEMSKDPFVAASFVRQTMDLPFLPTETVRTIVGARPEGKRDHLDAARMLSNLVGDVL